jgi:hypothetical protein
MGIPKVHHYVPQFLLKHFGNGKKDQVWVFDKVTKRSFSTNAKNVASESRFYEFKVGEEKVSLEPWLSTLESGAKPLLSAVLRTDSLAELGPDERERLAQFFSIQFTRGRTFREQWRALPSMVLAAFEARGDSPVPGAQAEAVTTEPSEDQLKAETGRFMCEAPSMFSHRFLAKDWVLAATDWRHPLIIGDNPLVMQNMIETPHRGNLGLGVPGIEIYFPISPTRALAMWCPSLKEVVFGSAGVSEEGRALSAQLSTALATGCPVRYSAENVENLNAMQVAGSERYLFSSTGDFDLVRRMLDEHPDLANGPRLAIQ